MDLRVTPRPIQSQTVNKLRDAILSGHFKPGQRLVESSLCQLINVSRSSVREAIRRLEGEKLIRNIPNKGPSVAELTWREAQDIYQVRALLEGEAVAQFTKRASCEDLRQMQAALRVFAKANEDDDAAEKLRATDEFYEKILSGCGNGIIRELLEGLRARINLLRSHSMSRKGRSHYSLREMTEIFKMIESKNAAGARKAAFAHVRAASKAAEKVLAADKNSK
jgi:DNA-binding GntR family transcriptional regulator